MRKINVLQVTSNRHGIGGVERLLLDMASHYDLSRFNITHCNLFGEEGGDGLFSAALKAIGLPCFELLGSRWYDIPRIVLALRRLLRTERVDVIHLHMVHATIIGSVVGLLTSSVKVLVTKHYTYNLVSQPALKAADRYLTNAADLIVAVSSHVRQDLVVHGASPSKITTIPNGTDLQRIDQEIERLPQLQSDALLIGCVGHLHPRKGHRHLLRAMPEILKVFPSVRLIVLGEGPERKRLAHLSESLGVAHALSLVGHREDVLGIVAQLDVYVHPSLGEPFGIAILEAMAARKSVVATFVDGIPEIVVDGVTGFLVPPEDPNSLADRICTLLYDTGLRRKMGKAGRNRVAEAFDIRRTLKSYEQLYSELAGSLRLRC